MFVYIYTQLPAANISDVFSVSNIYDVGNTEVPFLRLKCSTQIQCTMDRLCQLKQEVKGTLTNLTQSYHLSRAGTQRDSRRQSFGGGQFKGQIFLIYRDGFLQIRHSCFR